MGAWREANGSTSGFAIILAYLQDSSLARQRSCDSQSALEAQGHVGLCAGLNWGFAKSSALRLST